MIDMIAPLDKSLAKQIASKPQPIEIKTGRLHSEFARRGAWVTGLLDFSDGKVAKFAGELPEECDIDDRLEVVGQWEVHQKYGAQFRVDAVIGHYPATAAGILGWLKLLPNIGPERSKDLVLKFGARIWDLIERKPQELTKVNGITEERLQQILDAYDLIKHSRDAVVSLLDLGLTANQAQRALKIWGLAAYDEVVTNPYCLFYNLHMEFSQVDTIAIKHFGMPLNAGIRIEACAASVLRRETLMAGHCAIPLNVLLLKTHLMSSVETGTIELVIRDSDAFVIRDRFVLETRTDLAERLVADVIGLLYRRGQARDQA